MIRFDRSSAVVTYLVTLGRISVEVLMINVAHKALIQNRRLIQRGTFG
jgi:hypothetical protein